MAKKTDKTYFSRKFLNKKYGMAAIMIDGSIFDGFDIEMSDCGRKITLEFHYYGDIDRKEERLTKLDLIIEELVKARKFFFETEI